MLGFGFRCELGGWWRGWHGLWFLGLTKSALSGGGPDRALI
jgi:hypothetical protein